ncbi:DUF421 domain-containing protein [Marivirga sp. S37H4]|uniref:DUF421 domain-containing protein n=1 Tax=Marivirga aurantiaca TaxID=2802615 RepID=A0A934WZK7_9BACT|nr:YetF domain-containing protein [Marivirga aurantiaca]MBK6265670.1 DUF421 domain-containing protein [Marivirga aurantiaca]
MEDILSFLVELFGIDAENISIFQMLARAFVAFFIGIFLVRIGKKRFVGKMTAFDFILAITIGSLLSRSITKEKYFLEILASSLLLVVLHRLMSFLSAYSSKNAKLIKGEERILLKNGEIDWKQMKKSDLSEHDLLQSLRLNTNTDQLSKVKTAIFERNGDISFVLKDE